MIRIERTVPCAATIEDLQAAVTDFAHYPDFIPELAATEVLDRGRDWWIVEHELRAVPGVRYTLRYRRPPGGGLDWWLVGGLFRELRGSWRFRANGEAAALAVFQCEVDLPGLPDFLERPLVEAGVAILTRRFRERAEERLWREGPHAITRTMGRVESHDGIAIAYELLTGPAGVPLVYCNGLLQDTAAWVALVRELAPTHPQLLWDYRGAGGSERPRDLTTLTMENHCRDLRAVLDAVGIGQAVFLGHSMGAQTILEFYRFYPDRVLGLVPICGTFRDPFATLFDLPARLSWIWPVLLRAIEMAQPVVDPAWRALVSTGLGRELLLRVGTHRRLVRETDVQGFLANFARWDARTFAAAARELSRHSADPYLERIGVPTLVVAGEKDPFTPLHRSKEMAARIPGAELFVVPQGSHVAILEQPELIGLRIEKFIRERVRWPARAAPEPGPGSPGPAARGRATRGDRRPPDASRRPRRRSRGKEAGPPESR